MEKINALSNSNVILPGVSGGGNYYTYSVIVGDVANEGLLDMIVGHYGNQNQLLIVTASSTRLFYFLVTSSTQHQYVDNNGFVDIVVVDNNDFKVRIKYHESR